MKFYNLIYVIFTLWNLHFLNESFLHGNLNMVYKIQYRVTIRMNHRFIEQPYES